MKGKLLFLSTLVCWLIGPCVFLWQEHRAGLFGFPLDDAWIHQTYARSLASGEGWSYAGAPPSAGSTSPLWTLLQAPSFIFRLSPVVWSNLLGILLLGLNATLMMLWVKKVDKTAGWFAFLFSAAEWHCIWSALSGMEIMLFCCWISAVVCLFFREDTLFGGKQPSWLSALILGILAGGGIWIRPEAILLSMLVGGVVAANLFVSSRKALGFFGLGFLTPLCLYAFFEFGFDGRLLPNTYYAKTVEYSLLTTQPFFQRFLQSWLPLLAGSMAILVLFFLPGVYCIFKRRAVLRFMPALWIICHWVMYSIQLPASYQHGRYMIPVLPLVIGYSVIGLLYIRERLSNFFFGRVFLKAMWGSSILLVVIFIWIGAMQFSRDVEIIDDEMVRTSLWIRDNTPADTIVAAHDIGAIGFFGGRRIVDLGGVTDLDALDLLSGKTSLPEYLSRKHADLLMTFYDFYPHYLSACTPLDVSGDHGKTGTLMLLVDWRKGCSW